MGRSTRLSTDFATGRGEITATSGPCAVSQEPRSHCDGPTREKAIHHTDVTADDAVVPGTTTVASGLGCFVRTC
jgi:hypothetical protein